MKIKTWALLATALTCTAVVFLFTSNQRENHVFFRGSDLSEVKEIPVRSGKTLQAVRAHEGIRMLEIEETQDSRNLSELHDARTYSGTVMPNHIERSGQLAYDSAYNSRLSRMDEPPSQEREIATARVYHLPLIYSLSPQELSKKVPVLDPTAVALLKQTFEKALGDDQLAVDDPQYEQRWQNAELTLEQRMRLWYGWSAWSAYQHAMEIGGAQTDTIEQAN